MSLQTLKRQLRELAVKNLANGIERLQGSLDDKSTIKKDCLLLQGQFNALNRQRNLNLISSEEQMIAQNRILAGFLNLVDLIENEDLKTREKSSKISFNNVELDLDQLERSGLKSQAELIIKKLNKLKQALLLTSDASVEFKYEQLIAELELQLQSIKDQLN